LWVVVALAVALPLAGPAQADEFDTLFRQILRDPQNIEANMRYAQLAEQRGEERKAIAAYERVIEAEPGHPAATAALHRININLIPVVTQTRVELGVRYDSNPRQLPDGLNPNDDITGYARFRVRDQRPLFDNKWRSDLHGYFDVHDTFDQIDFWRLRGHSGPVFDLGNRATLQVAPGAAVAFLDADYFYVEPALRLRFENLFGGWLDRFEIRGAFRDIDNSFTSDDGFSLDINARKTQRAILTAADALLVQPFFRVREASGTGAAGGGPANFLDGDYIEAGGRIAYFVLLNNDLRIGASFTTHYRDYEQNVRFGTAERHDWYIEPGAEALFRNVVCEGCDIRLRYRYEQNLSNDGTEDYYNHSVIASGVRRF
jgi:hypothetical protein